MQTATPEQLRERLREWSDLTGFYLDPERERARRIRNELRRRAATTTIEGVEGSRSMGPTTEFATRYREATAESRFWRGPREFQLNDPAWLIHLGVYQ